MPSSSAGCAARSGTDRILFGSDFPLSNLDAALRAVRRLGFTRVEEQAILHDNADALFR